MKELEEVNCEIRQVINFQQSVTNRLSSLESNDNGQFAISQESDTSDIPLGGFLNDAKYAWLSYGSHLVVLNVRTGENISSWAFRGRITCVCQFPTQPGELPLLLVGLDNDAPRLKDSMGLLCVFDCSTSRVLRAIKMPAAIEQVCIVSGGAEWEEFNERRPDNVLCEMGGIACVALRNIQHIMVDLQRSTWGTVNKSIAMDEGNPAEIEFLTGRDSNSRNLPKKEKHAAFNLINSRIEQHIGFNREEFESAAILDEVLTSSIISSTKIGCLISGCLGRVIIWQNDGTIGWISPPVEESLLITHLALLEPTDDPRPFYYLWVVLQDELSKTPPLLRMYAMLFERKYCDRGTNLYFNLEADPSLKFEFELDAGDKVVSLCPIQRETNPDQTASTIKRGEDNLLLITTTDKSLLFDLNQWYKEQMPQIISELHNPNSILAIYRTQPQNHRDKRNRMINCTYVQNTLKEFPSNNPNSPEELFYPNSFSLEWVTLTLSNLTFYMTRGIQAELLREMAIAGPFTLLHPSDMFYKCLSVGLVPFNMECSVTSDQNAQRDMLLSLCLEQRWATFLVRCAKEWSDGSAGYLYPGFLKWGSQRASSIKMIADRLCEPLFDQSGSNIGEADVKTLRFCSQQLECLSNVVAKLPFETMDLVKQRSALRRVSTYLQVLLWFYDVGLLPESQDLEEGPPPISLALKVPYPFEKLFTLYKGKREQLRAEEEDNEGLFIDELIARECPMLKLQWEREAVDYRTNGCYPPPSLQSLLRSYLTDCYQSESNEIDYKHQITIYLLMDLAMLLQDSYPSVDQLIKYPSAFKMSPSLIKLTQAFWLLDHEDYQGFLDMMTGQLVSDSDVKDWHHKLVLRTLVRNHQHKLALTYLRIRKPPLTSVEEQSTLISLSVEHGLVQSAFHRIPPSHYAQLLLRFFQSCKTYGRLNDIFHLALDPDEEEVFVKFLEDNKYEDMRLLYYLQRCRYTEANHGNPMSNYNPASTKNKQFMSLTMLNAYNATLPDVIKRFSTTATKTYLDGDLESRYSRPMSHKSSNGALNIHENVIRTAKESFLRKDKAQIPFINGPCASLKTNDNQASCVVFPKLAEKPRGKRTFDQMYGDEDFEVRTPDGVKRCRLLDEQNDSNSSEPSDTKLSVAFNTPLVKRKSNLSRIKDTPTETPHSILKIRQMIRSSTSPCIEKSPAEVPDSPSEDKRANRQIRFNISENRTNSIQDEVNEDEDFPKADVSLESEDAYFSPNVSVKSYNETAILSDSSYNSNNSGYSPRPRPSLRRSGIHSSTDTLNETSTRSSKSRSSNSLLNTPFATRDNPLDMAKVSARRTPQLARMRASLLSTSIYSPAVLPTDSSFEMDLTSKRSDERYTPTSRRFIRGQDVNYNCTISSTPLIKNSTAEELVGDKESEMDMEDDEQRKMKSSSRKSYSFAEEHCDRYERMDGASSRIGEQDIKYKNGDVKKRQEEVRFKEAEEEPMESEDAWDEEIRLIDKEDDENEAAFESLSSTRENSVAPSEPRDQVTSFYREEVAEERECTSQKYVNIGNGENFDITDDESSNSVDLTTNKTDTNNAPLQADNIYDISNITDDESEDNRDYFERRKEKEFHKVVDVESDDKDEFNTSGLSISRNYSMDTENFEANKITSKNSELKEEGSVRMTRSRRASSITKESLEMLPINSPSKVTNSEKGRSRRRASSLAKELLSSSVLLVDESIKNTETSILEDSFNTQSPRTGRTRRSSSMAKEVLPTEAEDEARTPVRRSTRRAASVQKEIPELPKPLTKRGRTSSTSSLPKGENDEKNETKTARKRNSSTTKKTNAVQPSRTTRSSKTVEEEPEEDKPKSSRTRRASSLAKEVIPEDSELSLANVTQISVASSSFSKGTRSRRSSIQSIPEELEEILSVPSKGRSSANKKEATQGTRQRRATSLEPTTTETKRKTRSTRANSILEDTIFEEETTQPDEQINANKVPSRKKRAASVPAAQNLKETSMPKPRRTRKGSVPQESKEEYSFSEPDKADKQPVDEKAIRDVPNYVFSPPHTRSKTLVPDQHRRKIKKFTLSTTEAEEEEMKEEEVRPARDSSKSQQPWNYSRGFTAAYL